jgi:hypothetical protein
MMTEAQLYAAMEQLIISNRELAESNRLLAKEEHEKVDLLFTTVVTGDPENNKPGLLEVSRNHQKVLDNFSRGFWVMIGAGIVAIMTFTWEIIRHVALGLP